MQTTATVAVLWQDSLAAGHVGDCRLYRVRNGRIALLTRDHTIANNLLRLHLISAEQALRHSGRYQLTRSVGASPFFRVDLVREQIEPGDSFLLCSDGLWSEVGREDIRAALSDSNIESACQELVGSALKTGAPDNISAILFRMTRPAGHVPADIVSTTGN